MICAVLGIVGGICLFLMARLIPDPWWWFWAPVFCGVYGIIGSRIIAAYDRWCVKRDDESTS